MAQALASVAGLCGSSQAVLEGSLHLTCSNRLSAVGSSKVTVARSSSLPSIRAQQISSETDNTAQSTRRSVLGLVAAGLASGSLVKSVLAEARSIAIGPPPPPSGGLTGTKNADVPRDLDLPLKDRFYIQTLSAEDAAKRAKESAQDILGVKQYIDKKAWPYVQMDLRLKASYLRYDLNTVISAKPKEDKKTLKDLTGKLFSTIDELDHAAKIKSTADAEKYYAQTKTTLDDVLAKLG